MELYRKVRLACRDRMSERAAARHFGVSRESVRKMLEFSVPPGYRRTAPVRRPKLDGFTGPIDEWLRGDRKDEHRKQRHTAKRIVERLRDEHGFTGGYTIVKDHVREHHRRRSSAGSSRRFISSPSTYRKATRHTFGCIRRRRPKRGSTDTCTRSRFLARSRCRCCMTTIGVLCRGSSVTGRAGARGCSADSSRTTSSGTGTGAPARATTRGRWKVWWAGRAQGSVRNSVFGPPWPAPVGPTVLGHCSSLARVCRAQSTGGGRSSPPQWGTERFPRAVHGRGPLIRPSAGGQAVEIAGHDSSTTNRSPKRIASSGRTWCQNSGVARHFRCTPHSAK